MKIPMQHHANKPQASSGKNSRYLLLCAGLLCLFITGNTWAYCTAGGNSSVSFIPSPGVIMRDAPIGTIIATAQAITSIECKAEGSGGNEWQVHRSAQNVDLGAADSPQNVRNTTKTGVGIGWLNLSSATGALISMSGSPFNDTVLNRGFDGRRTRSYTMTDTFTLYKTGPLSSGELAPFELGYGYRAQGGPTISQLYTIRFAAFPIKQLACSVDNPVINVSLGTPSTLAFSGVGSSTNNIPVAIQLSCDADTRVNISFTGAPADTNADGVLALSDATAATTAQGIGIQLLFNNVPIKLDTLLSTGTTTHDGAMVLSFDARYYQISAAVTPGQANGSASFTMNYN